jgi:hypothetical protein
LSRIPLDFLCLNEHFPGVNARGGLVMLSFAATESGRPAMLHALIARVRRIQAAAANWRQAVVETFTDPYRPELHYMRGPGPKWRLKHATPTRPLEGRAWISTKWVSVDQRERMFRRA